MTLDYLIEKRNSHKAFKITSHMLFWLCLYCSYYYSIKTSYSIYRNTDLAFLVPIRQILGLIVVFYPLMYVIIPRFLIEKKWWQFIGYLSLLVFVYTFIEAYGEQITFNICDSCRLLAKETNPNHLSVIQKSLLENILYKASNIALFFTLFSNLVLPIAIKTSLGYYEFYTKNLRLEKEKIQLELNFLKAQVNPHFLFNTLNNLYSLIIQKRIEESAETVTGLSSFMRYSLENANKKSIQLSEEIKLLQNYVELEKLRLNYTKVSFKTNAENIKKSIPPLLFIPLIENAFKYNTDKEDTNIDIELFVENNLVVFNIQNSFEENKFKNKLGGFGLSNLKKRLDLYFFNAYVFHNDIDKSLYKSTLKIPLK